MRRGQKRALGLVERTINYEYPPAPLFLLTTATQRLLPIFGDYDEHD